MAREVDSDLPANVCGRLHTGVDGPQRQPPLDSGRLGVELGFDPGFDFVPDSGHPSHTVGRASGSACAIALGSATSVTCTPRTMLA